MQSIMSKRIGRVFLGLLLLSPLFFGTAAQAADRIPRILFVGDSWTGFMWGFRSLKAALDLPEYAADGLNRWIETGSSTAIMGAKAYEFLSDARKKAVAKSLADCPNIDVVIVTMGGNDFAGGFPVNIPGQGVRKVDWYDWYMDNEWDVNPLNPNPNPNQSVHWPEQALFDQLKSDMREILRNILIQRPDVRVAIVGYDRTCRKSYQRPGLTIARQNQGLLKMEQTKRDLAMDPEFSDRVEYIQSMGLIQNKYGYFTSNEWGETGIEPYPPARPLSEVDVAPGVAPLPGSLANGYNPWPGGDPLHQDPRLCYIDQDIHLQREGFDLIAKHALDVRIREWLNYPKVLSIIAQPATGGAQSYEVTFTHAVTGVDASDFELFVKTKADTVSGNITGVQSGDGGVTWTVTANPGGASGDVLLRVLDDDTILRADNGVPLGGMGAGNGVFEFNGTYVFHDMLRPEDNDFVGSLNYLDIASQPYLYALMPSLSFSPDRFDANGSFFLDGGSLQEPYAVPGNTILESYEFALITHMLNHPTLDLSATGGPKAADVIAAWQNNLVQMLGTLGGPGSIGDILLPGLDTMLAGYMTLGDNNSTFLAITLLTMLNSVDNFPTQVGTPIPSAYIGFPNALSAGSDPDGDGWTNEQEYAYFMPDGSEAYAAAALDPMLTPKRGDGFFAAGASTRMAVFDHPAWDGKFQWYRDGLPLSDGAGVSGSSRRCLILSPLGADDAGDYTCVYQTAIGSGAGRLYTSHTYPAGGPISVSVGANAPDLAGLTQDAAETALTGVNLATGTVTQQCSNTVAAGIVISQSVAAGQTVAFGTAVELVVSSGLCNVAVPNVAGLTQAAADTALTGGSLTTGVVTQECSNTVAAGIVISQDPAADQQAPFGSGVALVVSTGLCNVAVPGVAGLTQAAAGAALSAAGLTGGPVTQQCNNTVTAGLVISQDPPADQPIPFGSAVALTVSTGVCNVTVPTVTGLTQTAAGAALNGAGLVPGQVTEQCNNTVAAGLVISQVPAADQPAPFGSLVTLAVSTGLCKVTVPAVTGLTQAAAGAALTGAGLGTGTMTQQCSAAVAAGLVISQVPAADQQALFGSAVELTVSSGPCAVEGEAEGEGENTPPTETELRDLLASSLDSVDTNGDGQVSYAEALAALPGLPEAVFNAIDSDGNGQVTADEAGVDQGGCAGCAGGKGAFTFETMKKALGNFFLGGLSMMALLAIARRRP